MDMDIRDHASRLGIVMAHHEAFELLVDLMRSPETRTAELESLRGQLEAINRQLSEAGIDHPQGLKGVRDLAYQRDHAFEARDEAVGSLNAIDSTLAGLEGMPFRGVEGVKTLADWHTALRKSVKAAEQQAEKAKTELAAINRLLRALDIAKEDFRGVNKLAVLYEDARDKQAEEDLKELREYLNRQLRRADVASKGGQQGLRELVDRYLHDRTQLEWHQVQSPWQEMDELLVGQGYSRGLEGLKEMADRLEWFEGQLNGVDLVLAERNCLSRGLDGVRTLANHDQILTEDTVATNKALGRVGGIQHRGSRGVHELVDLYRVMQDQWVHDHKDEQVQIVEPLKKRPPTVIDLMGAWVADGHLVFEKDAEGEQG